MFERFKRRRKLRQMRKHHQMEMKAISRETTLPEEQIQNFYEAERARYILERRGL